MVSNAFLNRPVHLSALIGATAMYSALRVRFLQFRHKGLIDPVFATEGTSSLCVPQGEVNIFKRYILSRGNHEKL